VVGCCEHGNETFTFHYLQGISRLAEELSAFQEGLGCFEVGSCMWRGNRIGCNPPTPLFYLFLFSYEQIHSIPFGFIVFYCFTFYGSDLITSDKISNADKITYLCM
jgi:hypothetical protein